MAIINGNDGKDLLFGTAVDDVISGHSADDVLQGDAGNDKLDLSDLLDEFGIDPNATFSGGFVLLTKSGADTLVQFDSDGAGIFGALPLTLATVVNTTVVRPGKCLSAAGGYVLLPRRGRHAGAGEPAAMGQAIAIGRLKWERFSGTPDRRRMLCASRPLEFHGSVPTIHRTGQAG